MKFEEKYQQAVPNQELTDGARSIVKGRLGQCGFCSSMTRWRDVFLDTCLCSEECSVAFWKQYEEATGKQTSVAEFEFHRQRIKEEIEIAEQAQPATKDILIVVRDQLEYLTICIESIKSCTKNYNLYIWDNNSGPETAAYLQKLSRTLPVKNHRGPVDCSIDVMTSDTNIGFIQPNNEMASWGSADYLICLNSDTKVFDGWDDAMTGFLQKHPDVAEVGYVGGYLDETGKGCGGGYGYDVDFISGWCLCLSRKTYNEFGLFNKQLTFAYCEDADLSLRLKAAGKRIYALHAPLVHHFGNKTIIQVEKEGQIDVKASFDRNHEYMKLRWKDYLENGRVKKLAQDVPA